MSATPAPVLDTSTTDQRITFSDITWTDLEVLLAIRGDRAGTRMTYINGVF